MMSRAAIFSGRRAAVFSARRAFSAFFDGSQSTVNFDGSQSTEHQLILLQKEIEKLRADNKKLRSKLRYEIEDHGGDNKRLHSEQRYEIGKVTAGKHWDRNLEKLDIREEEAELREKIFRQLDDITERVKATKNDFKKYTTGAVIAGLVSGAAASLVVRHFRQK